MAVGFVMSDNGFDGGPPPQRSFVLSVDAALLARFEDPGRPRRIVARVAFIDKSPVDPAPGQRLGFLDHFLQGVSVVWTAGQRFGVQGELAALAASVGRGERDFDSELT